MDTLLEQLLDLLDEIPSDTVGTSLRIPLSLRDAAVVATDMGLAASTTELAVQGLRDALENFAQRAVLDAHYRAHPDARPSLAEVAQAAAELDGSALAAQPELIQRAAHEVAAIREAPSADDVLLYAAGLASAGGMILPATVVLDKEAVQSLIDDAHPKHRRVLAVVEAVVTRNRRHTSSSRLVVPTSVRVEAGWDRQAPSASGINRLRVADSALNAGTTDLAVRARAALRVSVADGHLAATLVTTAGPHAVVTSDPADLGRIARHLGIPVTVVTV